jgi:hypothetical protein
MGFICCLYGILQEFRSSSLVSLISIFVIPAGQETEASQLISSARPKENCQSK